MNINKKILPKFILVVLLVSNMVYFLDILCFHGPKIEMVFQSDEDKMDTLDHYIYGTLNFVKNNVEPNSSVLFFHYGFYVLGKPYLYPKVKKVHYTRYRNDEILISYIQVHLIDYICIISEQHHLASNFTIFQKIDYYPQIYLLKINRTAL